MRAQRQNAQVRNQTPTTQPPTPQPPRRTVAEYNADIDADNTLTTVTLSTVANPDANNPVLDYTYRSYNNIQLPVRIRAYIRQNHLRRGGDTRVDREAEKNCRAMGMNSRLANGNNDHLGHMVPYILGGPPNWYNIVPQTQRINIGTVTNTDVHSISLWRDTERVMQKWVTRDVNHRVRYEVLVAYNLPGTRPTGFGVIEEYYTNSTGPPVITCPGIWYSNDPNVDPDIWNL